VLLAISKLSASNTDAIQYIHEHYKEIISFASSIKENITQVDKMGAFAFFIVDYVSILNEFNDFLEAGKETVVNIFKDSLQILSEYLQTFIKEKDLFPARIESPLNRIINGSESMLHILFDKIPDKIELL
jgi:hypothetical protein